MVIIRAVKKGGETIIDVNQRTASIIHVAGFLLPIVFSLYGLLLLLRVITPFQQVDPWVFGILSVSWMALGAYQLLVGSRSRTESAIRLIAFHAYAIAYIFLVAGFSMPFVCCWAILLLASYDFFGKPGLRLSVVALLLTALADTLLRADGLQYTVTNLLMLVATTIVGLVAVSISQVQRIDHRELDDAREESLRERDRVVTLVNNLADAVLATDASGVIQVYNAASLSLLDTNAELVGTHIDTVLSLFTHDHKPFRLSKSLKAAKSVDSRDDLSMTVSEESIRLGLVYSPIRSTNSAGDKAIDGYIIILRDITKQKSLEEERDEFISVVSHELRTPITIAEGTLSNVMLMMGRADIPKNVLNQNVELAHDQVVFLAKMVNDLSTLSRAERGVADGHEDIDVGLLAQDLYREYSPQAQKKKLKFNLDLAPQPGIVAASPLYLKELLQNFITNAIKYTKTGSVTLRITKEKGVVHFAVIDTGIGISKSDQAHIFERFWRSEDYRTRETGGTGLGLYVARKLARKLGTTVRMSSRLNHGSTFSFELPAEK